MYVFFIMAYKVPKQNLSPPNSQYKSSKQDIRPYFNLHCTLWLVSCNFINIIIAL